VPLSATADEICHGFREMVPLEMLHFVLDAYLVNFRYISCKYLRGSFSILFVLYSYIYKYRCALVSADSVSAVSVIRGLPRPKNKGKLKK
jgi:hypothetical protein